MSDDLVKRLEFGSTTTMGSHRLNLEAAALIRELEAELAALREGRALTNELLTLLSRLGPIDQSHCRYHNKWYRVDDVVNDLRAALEPAPVTPAEAWQPIETAPKDGSRILAWANRHGWKGVPQMVCVAYYKEACRWYIYGAGPTKHSPQWLDECSPTHWMPLPLPPRALADAGEAWECGNCRFYQDNWDRPGSTVREGYGKCLRHPEPRETNDGQWCDEHQPTTPGD